jgi:cytosine/uracil/thiamine/allantoin permease
MDIPNASPSLYNEDLAPATVRNWGPFSIFNVWTSDVHSLWGYYLAASLDQLAELGLVGGMNALNEFFESG